MSRTVKITFEDGSTHIYQGVPMDVSPDAIEARARSEFPNKKLSEIDGNRGPVAEAPRVGATDVFGINAANSLLFGLPGLIPRYGRILEQSARQQPEAATAGSVAGALPSIVAGGYGGYRAGAALADAAGRRMAQPAIRAAEREAAEATARAQAVANARHQQLMQRVEQARQRYRAGSPTTEDIAIVNQYGLGSLSGPPPMPVVPARMPAKVPPVVSTAGRVAAGTVPGIMGAQTGAALTGLGGGSPEMASRAGMTGQVATAIPASVLPFTQNVLQPVSSIVPGMIGLFGP